MEKFAMREWVSALEEILDNKLRKWRKDNKIENGEVVQMRWQFEQMHFHMDVFWKDKAERIHLRFMSPRADYTFTWDELSDRTFNKVMDRVGNIAQSAMYPPIDPMD